MPDTITITPEIWRMRAVCAPIDHPLACFHGIAFDGTHAVATDGSMLVARPCALQVPSTWRFRFVSPAKIRSDVTVALDLGAQAVSVGPGRYGIVEIVDCREPIVDWRAVVPPDGGRWHEFSVARLRAIMQAADVLDKATVQLSIGGPRSPMRVQCDGIALIMPYSKPKGKP